VRAAVGLASANLDDQLSTIDGNVDAILEDTAEIGAAGAGLTEAGGTADHLTAVPWNASWDAEVQSECTDAFNASDPRANAEMELQFENTNQFLGFISGDAANGTAAAIRSELAVELARIDVSISSRLSGSAYTAPDNASIAATKAVTDKLDTMIEDVNPAD